MITGFDLEKFIKEKVTGREKSLLAADFKRYDSELHERIDGKRVLVIGGAGSIGSHYIKALLRFNVAKLVVVDISENGLTELVRDLRSDGSYNIPEDFVTYPVNFGEQVFAKLFHTHGPFDIVANFAAHKHVRSEKDVFSIEAMIENNVLRARGLLDMLLDKPPQHFFCVSTDKAANPVNLMGASKKLMEELIMAYADRLPIKTARFANVAFSNGSLPLGFLERLNKGQPWSCPVGIRRFFVSPIESGELCLMASIMGESGDIIYPKLDAERDMIPFDQIAMDLLAALGMEADVCVSEAEALLRPLSGRNEESKKGSQDEESLTPGLASGRNEESKKGSQDEESLTPGLASGRNEESKKGSQDEESLTPGLASGRNEESKKGSQDEESLTPGLASGRNEESKKGSQDEESLTPGLASGRNEESKRIDGVPRTWPVYFFESDTSGEKPYEEFYTSGEELDEVRFCNLGVVKNSKRRSLAEIDEIFESLHKLFAQPQVLKSEVVDVLKEYLPNFAHIETGKGLDQKM
jgi:nucleoside-diphosphate-sugar epimerase